MVSIELMLPYAGQKVDAYIVSIDSSQISVDCASFMTLIVCDIRSNDVTLRWSESRVLNLSLIHI